MADISPVDAGIPPTEDSIPDLSLLNIHSSVEARHPLASDPPFQKNQASMLDLNQDCIDRIAEFLDPKSLVRLQLTSKALYIDEHLGGRAKIGNLNAYERTLAVDAFRFNKLLQDFCISKLEVRELPVDYFNQPYIQKLEYLDHKGDFPVSLNFISDSTIHSGIIRFRSRLPDFDELNLLLKKWTANEKVIKALKIGKVTFSEFDEGKAFAGWRIVDGHGKIPLERPIVGRETFNRYRLIRTDGTVLHLRFDDRPNYITLSSRG